MDTPIVDEVRLTTRAEMPRGMTEAEAYHYLMTDELPTDTQDPTPGSSNAHNDVSSVSSLPNATSLNEMPPLTADAFKFDPNQPRDSEGRWTDTPSVGNSSSFSQRFDDALTGDEVLHASPVMYHYDPKDRHFGSLDKAVQDDVMQSIRTYSGESYLSINSYLRNVDPASTRHKLDYDMAKEHVPNLDKAMEASPLLHDVITYRGVYSPKKVFGSSYNASPGSMTGLRYRDDGFSSTSSSKKVAEDFSMDEVVLRILTPKGTHAVALSSGGENELLLDRGLTYKIVNDYVDDNGKRYFDVMVVGKKND